MLSGDLNVGANVTQDKPFELKIEVSDKVFILGIVVVVGLLIRKVKK